MCSYERYELKEYIRACVTLILVFALRGDPIHSALKLKNTDCILSGR